MRFEHRTDPVLPFHLWVKRVATSVKFALGLVIIALGIGIVGYHFLGGLGLVDAILESSMILGGMGAVAPMTNDAVKLFASAYALFSGLMMVSITGILLAPWLHRLLHIFHTDSKAASKKAG